MKLSPACKKIYELWRRGWDIRVNHRRRYAYLSGPGGEFKSIRYRNALKVIAHRDSEQRRAECPTRKRIWSP